MATLLHPRVLQKRPQYNERELIFAWEHAPIKRRRSNYYEPMQIIALGWDSKGRPIELVAYKKNDGKTWIIFHAAPVRKKFLYELGLSTYDIYTLIGRR